MEPFLYGGKEPVNWQKDFLEVLTELKKKKK